MESQRANQPAAASLWIEGASDWLNPILIKETRQSLKSRQFIATFLLMLVASWAISMFGMLLAGPGVEYRSSGKGFFYCYYFVLAIAIYVVVPFTAFRSLLSERDMHTYEVLSISTLTPRQIVWGKLLSALVQLFIYYSAITPFMAFTILLKGIDGPTIGFLLGVSMLWSLALSMVALTISTFANQRHWQVLLTLTVLGGLLMALFMASTMVGTLLANAAIPFDEPEFWWGVAAGLTYFAAYFVLLLQVAISQLTFDADNRSTGVRVSASWIFWMSVGWVVFLFYLSPLTGLVALKPPIEFLHTFVVFMGLHLVVTGLFAATESDVLSRRVRRNLQWYGRLRLFVAPCMPGGSRGLLFVLLHLVALWLFVVGTVAIEDGLLTKLDFAAGLELFANTVLDNHVGRSDRLGSVTTGFCLYATIYLGLGAAIGRWARRVSSEFRPAHARVLAILFAGLGMVAPHLIDLFNNRSFGTSDLYDVTDPFSTLISLGSGGPQSIPFLFMLAIGAFVSVAINLRAMIMGVMEVVTARAASAASLSTPPSVPMAAPIVPSERPEPAGESQSAPPVIADSLTSSS